VIDDRHHWPVPAGLRTLTASLSGETPMTDAILASGRALEHRYGDAPALAGVDFDLPGGRDRKSVV